MRKRHHFLPIAYLKRFTDSSGCLWQFDLTLRAAPNPFHATPRNAGVESYLYAPGVGPNPRSDGFEAWLGTHIDAPSAPVLAKVCSGEALSSAEELILAGFVVALRLRTPELRDRTLEEATTKAYRLIEDWRNDRETMRQDVTRACAAQGRSDDDAACEIEYWEGMFARGAQPSVTALTPFWLQFISRSIRETSLLLSGFDRIVFEPPAGAEFITSDFPVLRRHDSALQRAILGEPGWLSAGAEISLPLAPDRMLVLGRDRDAPLDRRGWWERWRSDLISEARHHFISRERPGWVHLEVAKRRFLSNQGLLLHGVH